MNIELDHKDFRLLEATVILIIGAVITLEDYFPTETNKILLLVILCVFVVAYYIIKTGKDEKILSILKKNPGDQKAEYRGQQ